MDAAGSLHLLGRTYVQRQPGDATSDHVVEAVGRCHVAAQLQTCVELVIDALCARMALFAGSLVHSTDLFSCCADASLSRVESAWAVLLAGTDEPASSCS
jgi:hypothetical protein